MINSISTPHHSSLSEDEITTVYVSDDFEKIDVDKSYTVDLKAFARRHPDACAVVQSETGVAVNRGPTASVVSRSPYPSLYMMCNGVVGFVISDEAYLYEAYGLQA